MREMYVWTVRRDKNMPLAMSDVESPLAIMADFPVLFQRDRLRGHEEVLGLPGDNIGLYGQVLSHAQLVRAENLDATGR